MGADKRIGYDGLSKGPNWAEQGRVGRDQGKGQGRAKDRTGPRARMGQGQNRLQGKGQGRLGRAQSRRQGSMKVS